MIRIMSKRGFDFAPIQNIQSSQGQELINLQNPLKNFKSIEQRVIPLVAAGYEDKMIAFELNLAVGYVKNTVQELMERLRIIHPDLIITNRVQVALWYHNQTHILEAQCLRDAYVKKKNRSESKT
jgi:DNA-binding NarL/FixJ family response regulator